MQNNYYKYDEIKNYFSEFVDEHTTDWISQNYDDLHGYAFNNDYYIIGTHKATQWLGDEVFNCINIIKQYEQRNFGEVTTDFSNPELVVNMYAYIVGEQVVSEWKEANPDADTKW